MSGSGGLGIIIAGAVGTLGGVGNTPKLRRSIGPIIANITIDEHHTDILEITQHPVEQGASISDHVFIRPFEVTIRCSWSNSPSSPGSLVGNIAGALTNKAVGALSSAVTNAAHNVIGGSALTNLAVANLQGLTESALTSFGATVNTGTGTGTTVVQDVYASLQKLQQSETPFDVYTGKRMYTNMMIKMLTADTDKTTENSLSATLQCQQIIIVNTVVTSVPSDPSNQTAPQDTAPPANVGTQQLTAINASQNPGLQAAFTSAIKTPNITFANLTN
jgi:hypothetical protein